MERIRNSLVNGERSIENPKGSNFTLDADLVEVGGGFINMNINHRYKIYFKLMSENILYIIEV